MPSPRKRIGFLPGVEIQEIIDKICIEEKLSQSKVTGLLVEDALKRRGLYKPIIGKKELVETLTKVVFSEDFESQQMVGNSSPSEVNTNKDDLRKISSNNNFKYNQDEFDILKEFLEYKRFKNMMKRAREEDII